MDVFEEIGLEVDFFKQRGLPEFDDAKELVKVQVDEDGRVHELTSDAARAWWRMKFAAAESGHELILISAFRSYQRQAEIVRAKHRAGKGVDEIFAVSAPPGFSEHHTGRAVDISAPGYEPLEEVFEESAAFQWLMEHAENFGFSMTYPKDNRYGFLYEPWHWCFHSSQHNEENHGKNSGADCSQPTASDLG